MGQIMNLLAAGDAAAGMNGGIMLIVYVVAIVGLMYFLTIRPQRKEQARMQAMMESLEVGDSVLTNSGFYGVIIDIADADTVIVEFGNNKNCRIAMQKAAISQVEKAGKSADK